MDLRETYDRIAEDWHCDHLLDDWWVEGTRMFASRLRSGQTVLDVGCGSGIKSAYLADKGFEVVGIDISERMIKIARREYPYVAFRVHDMRHASRLGCTFDAVFAQASLLHIPKFDVKRVLLDWWKVLQPNGVLYVAVKGIHAGRPAEETRREDDYGYAYDRFFSYFSPEELGTLLEWAGFRILEEFVEHLSPGAYGWIQMIARRE